MSFLFQSLLTIGLPLVALPLVIHLINLRRHKQVNWAAMDFLLESQKRNKKWIMLRQLLLLLLRTSAIALVVLMLAGPILMSAWGSLLGSGETHHIVLVDDSFSMADRWQDDSAWDEAKHAVSQILQQATSNAGIQKITLLRFSDAQDLSAGKELPFASRMLDRRVLEEIDSYLESVPASETAVGPIEAFQAALAFPEGNSGESRILYVISDFRTRQWKENAQTRQLLGKLENSGGRSAIGTMRRSDSTQSGDLPFETRIRNPFCRSRDLDGTQRDKLRRSTSRGCSRCHYSGRSETSGGGIR